MKKALFIFFTVISLLNYAAAAYVLYIYYTGQNAVMSLLLFMPLLIIGILSGLISFGVKNFFKLVLTGLLANLYKLNMVLFVIGNLAFVYYYLTLYLIEQRRLSLFLVLYSYRDLC